MSNTINCTEEQWKVIKSDKKNVFVMATAGSGKTTTMTQTVKYKVENGIYKPGDIYMTSFTNKDMYNTTEKLKKEGIDVAEETRDHDLDEDIYVGEKGVSVSTLHVLARTVISNIAENNGLSINDRDSNTSYNVNFVQQNILEKHRAEVFGRNGIISKMFANKTIEHLDKTYVQQSLVQIMVEGRILEEKQSVVKAIGGDEEKIKICNELHNVYGEEFNADMIERALNSKKKAKLSINLHNTFILANLMLGEFSDRLDMNDVFPKKLLIIDECQDLSKEQLRFITLLKKHFDFQLYMVGDLNQSIYGWRDADPLLMKEWMDKQLKEEGSVLFPLSVSFRLPNEESCILPNAIAKQSPLYDPSVFTETVVSEDKKGRKVELSDYDKKAMYNNETREKIAEKYNLMYLEPYSYNNFDNVWNLVKKLIYVDGVKADEIGILVDSNNVRKALLSNPLAINDKKHVVGRNQLNLKIKMAKTYAKALKGYLFMKLRKKNGSFNFSDIDNEIIREYYRLLHVSEDIVRDPYVQQKGFSLKNNEKKIDTAISKLKNFEWELYDKIIKRESAFLEEGSVDYIHNYTERIVNTLDEIFKYAKFQPSVDITTVAGCKGQEYEHVIYVCNRKSEKSPSIEELIDNINKMFVTLTRSSNKTYIVPCMDKGRATGLLKNFNGKTNNYEDLLKNNDIYKNVKIGLLSDEKETLFAYRDLYKGNYEVKCATFIETGNNTVELPYNIMQPDNVNLSKRVDDLLFYPYKPICLDGKNAMATVYKTKDVTEELENDYLSFDNVRVKRSIKQILNNQRSQGKEFGTAIEDKTRERISFDSFDNELSEDDDEILVISKMTAEVMKKYIEERFYDERIINADSYLNLSFDAELDFQTKHTVVEMKCTTAPSEYHLLQAITYAVMLESENNKKDFVYVIYPLELDKKGGRTLIEVRYEDIPKEFIEMIRKYLLGYEKDTDWVD